MPQNDPHSYTDISQAQITSINWQLFVDFENHKLVSEVVLNLINISKPFIDLDTRDIKIHEVKDKHANALVFTLDEIDPIRGSRLRINLSKNSSSITIKCESSAGATALQWLEPENTEGKKHPYLFSQCQPHHGRSIIPLQDSPVVRFTYKASVTVPKPLVAVMAASPGEVVDRSDGELITYSFDMPQPIPSYLLAFAVGNIVSKDVGPRTRVYSEPEILEKAVWEFGQLEQFVNKAEQLFGPYLWDRYDVLVMPPAFPYGGMENPRLNFITPTIITGDRSSISLIAHELAHSWTGNLVTNASMNDFWLNEGFTVWAERRITEAMEGKDAVEMEEAVEFINLQEEIKRFGEGSPFSKLKTNLEGINPDDVYSRVPYEKGYLFVKLLEQSVGRERFDEFIKSYIEKFKFTSINTAQLIDFIQGEIPGLLERVNGNNWIFEPGIPGNALILKSKKLEEITDLANGTNIENLPSAQKTSDWQAREWLVYLSNLRNNLGHDLCQKIDATYDLTNSNNPDILSEWICKSAYSSYEPAYPKISEFLCKVGRMKYLKPIYGALTSNPDTFKMALEIFENNKKLYHPIAVSGLELIFKKAKDKLSI